CNDNANAQRHLIFVQTMYDFFRNILFWFPPEQVHYFSMNCMGLGRRIPGFKNFFHSSVTAHPSLKKELFGLTFINPVGLAAGFDKNALYLSELEMMGFGSVEIGTVTPRPQEGNEKPRLFRIPQHQAIINRMGFNNHGVKVVAERLRHWRNTHRN